MEPITTGLLTGAAKGVANLLSGLFGQEEARRQERMQHAAIDEAVAALEAQGVPPAEALNVVYERYAQAGTLTPEMEQTFSLKSSELENVNADQAMRQKRMDALRAISERGQVGMTAEERAARESLLQDAANVAASNIASIRANQASQGQQGSSGANLALQASMAQNAGNQAAKDARNLSVDMEKRALDAMLQSGDLARQIEQDTLNLDTRKAQAMDAIREFNTRNAQSVAGKNVQSRNTAQATNLQNAQDTMDKNTGLSNREKDIASANKAAEYAKKRQMQNDINALKMKKAGYSVDADRASSAGTRTIVGGAMDAIGTGIAAATKKATDDENALTKTGGGGKIRSFYQP